MQTLKFDATCSQCGKDMPGSTGREGFKGTPYWFDHEARRSGDGSNGIWCWECVDRAKGRGEHRPGWGRPAVRRPPTEQTAPEAPSSPVATSGAAPRPTAPPEASAAPASPHALTEQGLADAVEYQRKDDRGLAVNPPRGRMPTAVEKLAADVADLRNGVGTAIDLFKQTSKQLERLTSLLERVATGTGTPEQWRTWLDVLPDVERRLLALEAGAATGKGSGTGGNGGEGAKGGGKRAPSVSRRRAAGG